MLKSVLKPHRGNLKAGTADVQKVFAMLKLIPDEEVARSRPPLAFALVIDTSGSMREFADQHRAEQAIRSRGLQGQQLTSDGGSYQAFDLSLPTKIDQAIEAAHVLIDDDRLALDDKVTVVHFDDDAKVLLPLTSVSNKQLAHQSIESLRNFSGSTHMAKGMRSAHMELVDLPHQTAKRMLLFTDGQTFDEAECRVLGGQFAEANTPIIAIGIGPEYNENLMLELSDVSQGRPYHLQQMSQLQNILELEIGSLVREVVTDLHATVASVKGTSLDSFTRVYPSLSEVALTSQPYRLGNVTAGDYTIFVLEFTLAGFARPRSRVRMAQVGLTGQIPGNGRREELPPQDLHVAFTTDEAEVAAVDPEVLGYVQQKNLDRIVQDAVGLATRDVGRARQTLQAAIGMTQRIGNSPMTQVLQNTLDELNKTGTISAGTRKTVMLGGRTKTMKLSGATTEGLPSEDEIRKLTGA